MRTAEDFLRDFGETEESFRTCVRQTLTALECREEKPVKKKINMGLVLAAVIVLLTGTAIAEEQWGILSFLHSRGKAATEEQLLSLFLPPTLQGMEHKEHDLVDAVVTEALYEDGKLYLAVNLTPLKENTLVAPMPGVNASRLGIEWGTTDLDRMKLYQLSMQEALRDPAYGDVSVLDYAKANGFDQVVLMDAYSVNLYNNQGIWLKDVFGGVQHTEFNLLADGTLQLILEVGYQPDMTFLNERLDTASVNVSVWAFDVRRDGEPLHGTGTSAHASFVLPDDRARLVSTPEDAHDIVGYIGEVDFISIAPYDDTQMVITVQLNLRDDATEDTWMSGPAWVVMDADGNRLCTVDIHGFTGLRTSTDQDGNRYDITRGLFPADCMPEGNQIILRAENWNNYNIVYDEYTYTLTGDTAAP